MTANELADNLEEWVSPRTVEQAVTMLRQQQAEIEALKLRELTDEEIAQESAKFYPDVFHTHLIQFAKALLKKASEK